MEIIDWDEVEKDLSELVQSTSGFTSDSRLSKKDSIFVALEGANVDGHDFVRELVEKGQCHKAVVDRSKTYSWDEELLKKCIVVPSSPQAHRMVARLFREKVNPKVVAIGGSAGKTSTKDFLHVLCEGSFDLIVTKHSQNGEQGIPKTLEGLHSKTELAIIEVGIDRPGDMLRHAQLLQPDMALLTSIGEEHLENLLNIETVFEEETLLFKVTEEHGGQCFAPQSDSYLARYSGSCHYVGSSLEELIASAKSPFDDFDVLQGNLCLAVKVSLELGVPPKKIIERLNKIEVPEGRGQVKEVGRSQVFVLDHYNSNPASLKAALESAKRRLQVRSMPLYLFLGDMLELGDGSVDYHKECLEKALKLNPEKVVLIGKDFKKASEQIDTDADMQICENVDQALFAANAASNWPGLFLFKGSRGMRLEKLFNAFDFDAS